MGRRAVPPPALTLGPFTVADARKVGVERWHLRGASWRRVARGMYVWSGLEQTPMATLAAARARLSSSAVSLDLWPRGCTALTLSRAIRSRSQCPDRPVSRCGPGFESTGQNPLPTKSFRSADFALDLLLARSPTSARD